MRTSPRRSSAAAARAACTRSWSTRSRSRRTSSAQQYSLILGSMFQIEATARPGHTVEELEKAIDEELAAFRADAARRAAKSSARATRSRRNIIGGLERLGGFGGVADRLNSYNHYLGTPDYLQQDIAALSRGDAGARAGVRARRSSRRTRASSCTRCRASRTLGAQVPTPPAPQAAHGRGRRIDQRRRAVAQRDAEGRAGAAAAAADAGSRPRCRTG